MLSIKVYSNTLPPALAKKLETTIENKTYVLYLNNEIIGHGQLLLHKSGEIELAYIEIKKELRGQQLGKRLVNFMIWNSPFEKITATSITPEFFLKLGFTVQPKFPSFVDHSSRECRENCQPHKCTSLLFEKASFLKKASEYPALQKKYFELIKGSNTLLSDFSITNNIMWDFIENHYYIEIAGFVFLVVFPFDHEPCSLIPPVKNIPAETIETLLKKLKSANIKHIRSLTCINKNLFSHQTATENRNNFDYLYLTKEFASFAGKKFEKKRNRLKKFLRDFPDYQLTNVLPQHHQEIIAFVQKVCPQQQIAPIYCSEVLGSGLKENLLAGFFVTIKGNIAGCLFYSESNSKTINVHFEFIDSIYDGIAQFLNNQLGKMVEHKYDFINREIDLGLPGLRKSKLSYRPYRLLKKYDLVI